jgi:hypothetical protein
MQQLVLLLAAIAKHLETPFHIYDEAGIITTGERIKQAFFS